MIDLSATIFLMTVGGLYNHANTGPALRQLDLLQGEWRLVALSFQGKERLLYDEIEETLTIKGDWFSGNHFFEGLRGRISIDAKSSPERMSVTRVWQRWNWDATEVYTYDLTENRLILSFDGGAFTFVRERLEASSK